MIVTANNQRLYLKSWNYNAAKILSRLAVIVTDNGGRVEPLNKAIISNSSRDAAIREYSERVEKYTALEKNDHNPARAAAILEYSRKLEKLQAVNNDPITVTHTSYIHFILGNCLYYYEVNDNPFFDFHYRKIPVVNGTYNAFYYSNSDKKEWLYDCFFRADCSDADITEAAYLIFNMLVNAKFSTVYNQEHPRIVKVDF